MSFSEIPKETMKRIREQDLGADYEQNKNYFKCSYPIGPMQKCDFCGTLSDMLEHFASHTAVYRYNCLACQKAFQEEALYQLHLNKCDPSALVHVTNDSHSNIFHRRALNVFITGASPAEYRSSRSRSEREKLGGGTTPLLGGDEDGATQGLSLPKKGHARLGNREEWCPTDSAIYTPLPRSEKLRPEQKHEDFNRRIRQEDKAAEERRKRMEASGGYKRAAQSERTKITVRGAAPPQNQPEAPRSNEDYLARSRLDSNQIEEMAAQQRAQRTSSDQDDSRPTDPRLRRQSSTPQTPPMSRSANLEDPRIARQQSATYSPVPSTPTMPSNQFQSQRAAQYNQQSAAPLPPPPPQAPTNMFQDSWSAQNGQFQTPQRNATQLSTPQEAPIFRIDLTKPPPGINGGQPAPPGLGPQVTTSSRPYPPGMPPGYGTPVSNGTQQAYAPPAQQTPMLQQQFPFVHQYFGYNSSQNARPQQTPVMQQPQQYYQATPPNPIPTPTARPPSGNGSIQHAQQAQHAAQASMPTSSSRPGNGASQSSSQSSYSHHHHNSQLNQIPLPRNEPEASSSSYQRSSSQQTSQPSSGFRNEQGSSAQAPKRPSESRYGNGESTSAKRAPQPGQTAEGKPRISPPAASHNYSSQCWKPIPEVSSSEQRPVRPSKPSDRTPTQHLDGQRFSQSSTSSQQHLEPRSSNGANGQRSSQSAQSSSSNHALQPRHTAEAKPQTNSVAPPTRQPWQPPPHHSTPPIPEASSSERAVRTNKPSDRTPTQPLEPRFSNGANGQRSSRSATRSFSDHAPQLRHTAEAKPQATPVAPPRLPRQPPQHSTPLQKASSSRRRATTPSYGDNYDDDDEEDVPMGVPSPKQPRQYSSSSSEEEPVANDKESWVNPTSKDKTYKPPEGWNKMRRTGRVQTRSQSREREEEEEESDDEYGPCSAPAAKRPRQANGTGLSSNPHAGQRTAPSFSNACQERSRQSQQAPQPSSRPEPLARARQISQPEPVRPNTRSSSRVRMEPKATGVIDVRIKKAQEFRGASSGVSYSSLRPRGLSTEREASREASPENEVPHRPLVNASQAFRNRVRRASEARSRSRSCDREQEVDEPALSPSPPPSRQSRRQSETPEDAAARRAELQREEMEKQRREVEENAAKTRAEQEDGRRRAAAIRQRNAQKKK